MTQHNAISMTKGGINQLADEVRLQIKATIDIDKQLADIAIIINNFVLQTLGAVSDNKDLSEVNQTLVNSLIQIKDFISERPTVIKSTCSILEQKLDAYEQCLLIVDDAATTITDSKETNELSTDKKKE